MTGTKIRAERAVELGFTTMCRGPVAEAPLRAAHFKLPQRWSTKRLLNIHLERAVLASLITPFRRRASRS